MWGSPLAKRVGGLGMLLLFVVAACGDGGEVETANGFCSVNETVGEAADDLLAVEPDLIAERVLELRDALPQLVETAPPETGSEVTAMVDAYLGFLGAYEQIGYDISRAADPDFQEAAAAIFEAGGPTVDQWVEENCETPGFFGGELIPPP